MYLFDLENFQCEHTTHTIYTTKRHRVVHKYNNWHNMIDITVQNELLL